jgi:hypothetical protein
VRSETEWPAYRKLFDLITPTALEEEQMWKFIILFSPVTCKPLEQLFISQLSVSKQAYCKNDDILWVLEAEFCSRNNVGKILFSKMLPSFGTYRV